MAISHKLENLRIKLLAARYVLLAGKTVPVSKLTLRTMTMQPARYTALAEGLAALPLPEYLTFGRKRLPVPVDVEQFGRTITYGQRLYFAQKEGFDLGIILRYIAGYYYPLATARPWNEAEALKFGRKVLALHVTELYPVSQHLVNLMAELATREQKLLHREPSKQERAAGIERLNRFADLTALIFLMEQFKCDEAAVMLKPYDDCLVRFMLTKEQGAYQERLTEIYRKENEPKKHRK